MSERDFRPCLAAHRGKSSEAGTEFRQAVYEQIRHVDGQQGGLTIERMCGLAVVSRAGYYRFCKPAPEADDEEESKLRDAIQRTAIESRQYGYRRVTRALRDQGWKVNRKRVARLMREDGLLAIRKRRFVPQTTDSGHDLEVAVNIARRLTATAINQLWVADITYVRLGRVDVFLAVVMDAFSRKIVGWNLAPKLTTELALTALRNAIDSRKPAPGLIHHSDRGVQYASVAYVDTLLRHGIIPSMSRPGNPYSALGYKSPDEFERQVSSTATAEIPQTPKMSFSRHLCIMGQEG